MNPRLQLAMELAALASTRIRDAFERRQHTLSEKSANDFATDTDREVEAMMATHIAQRFPGDVLLGEEGGERLLGDAAATGVRWIVDPLDGTFNFVHGFPYIATSIAIEARGVLRVGVIANPLTGEVFSAGDGFGAWRHIGDASPQRLHINQHHALRTALVGSVLPSAASSSFERVFPAWTAVARQAGSIRRTGAAALDLAHVAAGRLDGFFVMSLAAWDAAAGALLVREAGGAICDFEGGDDFMRTNQVIAGSPSLATELVQVLRPFAVGVQHG